MRTTPTRPWHNAILLFVFIFFLPAIPIIFAEGAMLATVAPMIPTCEEVFRFCAAESNRDRRRWEECVREKGGMECVAETYNTGDVPMDECDAAYQRCEASYAVGSPAWKDCLEIEAKLLENDPQCPHRWKLPSDLEQSIGVPPPVPREEWNRGGWGEGEEGDHDGWEEGEEGQEGDLWEDERGWDDEGEGDGEEDAEGEEWLADLEENLDHFDEKTQNCLEDEINAARGRCEVSDVPRCFEKVAKKHIITEAQCGGDIFDVVEFEESGEGEIHDFQESYEEHREGGGGCVPRHATLEGVKEEMFGRAPGEIHEEFERRKLWMAKMATEHGGDPEEMMKKFDGMPACEEWSPGERHGPPMGMQGMMMGPRDGKPGPSIGEIFGRAVGMLVELSQRSELNDEQKALIRETLAWFSDALNRVGAGEDVRTLAEEARKKLEDLMATMGGGSFMGGPNIEMMQGEIERMLKMVKMMVEKIPQAMAMMAEMGYAVEGWEAYYEEIKEQAATVEKICREKVTATSTPSDAQECFNAMRNLFEEKMEGMGEYVSKSVPPEAMREVEGKMGFDKMGMPGEHRGPPEGMEFHERGEGRMGSGMDYEMLREKMERCQAAGKSKEECKRMMFKRRGMGPGGMMNRKPPPGEWQGEGSQMKPPMMGMPEGMGQGMHIPEHLKEIARKCFEEGGSEEDCRKKVAEAMLRDTLACDQRTGGDYEKCVMELKQQFNLPPGAFPPSGE